MKAAPKPDEGCHLQSDSYAGFCILLIQMGISCQLVLSFTHRFSGGLKGQAYRMSV